MRLHIGRSALLAGAFRTSLADMARARSKTPKTIRGVKPLLSDEQILEMRALRDFAGWSVSAIARRYDLDENDARRYVDGITRAKLCARPCHLPEGVAALC